MYKLNKRLPVRPGAAAPEAYRGVEPYYFRDVETLKRVKTAMPELHALWGIQ